MSLAEIIDQAVGDGVNLRLSASGHGLVIGGSQEAVKRWLPVLGGHKAALLSFLGESSIEKVIPEVAPHPCQEPAAMVVNTKHKPSLAALAWFNDNGIELKTAGWTSRELYRRNKSKGLLWLSIWNRPGLNVSTSSGGVIEFRFDENGTTIRQTARPMK